MPALVEQKEEADVLPKAWLLEKISVQQAEANEMHNGVPFGGQNDRWLKLRATLQDGDTIWTFCSPDESWAHHAGRAGIAVVRNDRVVLSLSTILN